MATTVEVIADAMKAVARRFAPVCQPASRLIWADRGLQSQPTACFVAPMQVQSQNTVSTTRRHAEGVWSIPSSSDCLIADLARIGNCSCSPFRARRCKHFHEIAGCRCHRITQPIPVIGSVLRDKRLQDTHARVGAKLGRQRQITNAWENHLQPSRHQTMSRIDNSAAR